MYWLSLTKYAYNNSVHSVIEKHSTKIMYDDYESQSKWKKFIMNDESENDSTRRKKSLNNSLIRARILKFTNLKKEFEKRLKNVKKFQIKYYNKCHNFQFYKIKNRILLNFKNIIFNQFSTKWDFKFDKSYEITNFVKKMTYRQTLLKAFQSRNIHDVFYVLLLESYINKFDIDSKSLVIEIRKKKKQWKVESIFDDRIHRKKKQFLVK